MVWEPNAVDASLVATVAALLGVLVTNQGKVSEFRQKWIDALREDASALVTNTYFVAGARLRGNVEASRIDESVIQINQVSARIRLRLNPKEKQTDAILAAMNKIETVNQGAAALLDLVKYVDEFVAAVQKVLKKEWRRVKWGEPLYRGVFVLAIVAVLLSVLAFMHQNFNWHIAFIPGLK